MNATGFIAPIALLLVACGGGGSSAPVAAVAPVAPVVFIGDSITESWPLPAGSVNKGIGGQSSQQMLQRFVADVLSLKPSKVVIEAGTNDVGAVGANTAAIASMALMAQDSGAAVVLVNVMSRNGSALPNIRTIIQEFNAELLSLCNRQHYTCVDAYSATTAPDGSLKASLTYDGLHLNDEGYKILNGLL